MNAQSQSRRVKENRRRLARATARYFRELDDEAVKEEKQLAHDFSSCARSKAQTVSVGKKVGASLQATRLNNS